MMSAVYGGQIDNLGAFQRHILGCADLDVFRIRLVVLSEAAIIEIESDPNIDPQLECAPEGGQVARLELTGNAGLSEDGSHGQAPNLQY